MAIRACILHETILTWRVPHIVCHEPRIIPHARHGYSQQGQDGPPRTVGQMHRYFPIIGHTMDRQRVRFHQLIYNGQQGSVGPTHTMQGQKAIIIGHTGGSQVGLHQEAYRFVRHIGSTRQRKGRVPLASQSRCRPGISPQQAFYNGGIGPALSGVMDWRSAMPRQRGATFTISCMREGQMLRLGRTLDNSKSNGVEAWIVSTRVAVVGAASSKHCTADKQSSEVCCRQSKCKAV
jgi:hypothetical protein